MNVRRAVFAAPLFLFAVLTSAENVSVSSMDALRKAVSGAGPGEHSIELEILGPDGRVVERREIGPLEVVASRREYRSIHWISLHSVMRH